MLTKLFRKTKPIRRTQLNLVSLEARDVPAAFAVINTNDAGIGSLRQAITNANGNPGSDEIVFAAGTFSNPQTIALTSGQITITGGLTITGPGSSLLTISGNNSSRIFNDTASGIGVNINDVTLSGGKVTGLERGGAVLIGNNSTVMLYNCVVTKNQSANLGGAVATNSGQFFAFGTRFSQNSADDGGALFLGTGASVSFNQCTFEKNSVAGNGGAVFAGNAFFQASDTTFADNTAGFDGGGLFFDFGGNLGLYDCTFTGNKASSGGAIDFENGNNAFSTRLIRNSTFANNVADFNGGAINFLDLNAGSAFTIQNSTLVGNTAGNVGGGIVFNNVDGVNGTVNVQSSIVAGNTSPSGADLYSSNIFSTISSAYSALGKFSGGNHIGVANLPGVWTPMTLKLGTLADNGGFTKTIALADDSPARNVGFNYGELSEDQRNEPRVTNGQADIGAYETRQQFIVTNNKDSGTGSLRQAVLDANAYSSSGDLITFDPSYFNVARQITLTGASIFSNDAVEIDGPGAKSLTINSNGQPIGLGFIGGSGTSILRGVTLTGTTAFALYANLPTFVLDRTVVTGNTSTTATAVYIEEGEVTISNSSITGNSNNNEGGGVEFFNTTRATILNSTIANNTAGTGGGIMSRSGILELINSTVSGNSANLGGGIHILNQTAPVRIVNSTITNNTAGSQGGGLHVPGTPNQSIELVSSVVAGNTAPSAKDVFTFHVTTPVNARASAVGSLAGIAQYNDLGGNITPGTDLKLNPLTNSGGLGGTHLPRPGSPLLNNGSNPFNLATDQRGFSRDYQGGVDIGAVEAQIAPQITVRIDDGNAQRSRVRSITATFDRIVNLGPLAFDVVRQGPDNPGGPLDILVDTSLSTPTQTIATITWNDPDFTQHSSLIDGNYFLAAFQGDITDTSGVKLDGNGDGLGGDTGIYSFHRLFGDGDGNKTVDATDLASFGNDFGYSGESDFDFDANNTVDATDLAQFGNRFGVTL